VEILEDLTYKMGKRVFGMVFLATCRQSVEASKRVDANGMDCWSRLSLSEKFYQLEFQTDNVHRLPSNGCDNTDAHGIGMVLSLE